MFNFGIGRMIVVITLVGTVIGGAIVALMLLAWLGLALVVGDGQANAALLYRLRIDIHAGAYPEL